MKRIDEMFTVTIAMFLKACRLEVAKKRNLEALGYGE